MKYKPNSYLVRERSSCYAVKVSLPLYMRSLFGNRTAFMRSTGTTDIREARVIRDRIMYEFFTIRDRLKPKPQGNNVDRVLNELRQVDQYVTQNAGVNFATARVCPSLIQLRDEFIVQHNDRRKLSTLSKYIKAVEVFTAHFRCKDFRLHEINRTMVTDWLDKAKQEKASQTLANYLGCLSQLVALAQNRYHDAPKENVFTGHKLDVRRDRESYEPFTGDELSKVYTMLDEEMKAVAMVGMYSGMRLNEICSLQISNIKTVEGVWCFEVTEGKTRNAARLVPIHSRLIALVKRLIQDNHNGFLFYHASITERADGKRSTWHTQRFTRAKRKALGEQGTERKVFHSLRGMFVSQLDRKGVPEDRIALIVGHERGKTESFRTYSKGAGMKELSEYVELVSYEGI
ncbi:site-specific integrase [Klebsiella aerogenes]|uniref:site-specific integrase n=1 Tax=Klebsiella aerogenes TaxID=548 RepID=UPI002551372A|nr:site-specific integrase [Klebsiella aerogenes]MDK6206563.1 site-specific integrase [Klebsiella aerogenes]MDK6456045.1 site-specific integrase [Klebsiella aerogenes]